MYVVHFTDYSTVLVTCMYTCRNYGLPGVKSTFVATCNTYYMHTYIHTSYIHTLTYIQFIHVHCIRLTPYIGLTIHTINHTYIHTWALSDLRGVKKQHFGIHHHPAEILSLNSSLLHSFLEIYPVPVQRTTVCTNRTYIHTLTCMSCM